MSTSDKELFQIPINCNQTTCLEKELIKDGLTCQVLKLIIKEGEVVVVNYKELTKTLIVPLMTCSALDEKYLKIILFINKIERI